MKLSRTPTVMKRIEPSRKHGPFDPRWIALRRLKDAERPTKSGPRPALRSRSETWESEGGAVLAGRARRTPRDRLGVRPRRVATCQISK